MYFNTPQFWWIAAAALAVAEYLIPGTIFIFPAAAAAVTAVLAGMGMNIISLQVGVFILLSGVFLFFMRPIWMRFAMGETRKTGVDAMIGREALVVEALDKQKGSGRVKLGADVFPARSADGHPIAEGRFVKVKKIEGITVTVEESDE